MVIIIDKIYKFIKCEITDGICTITLNRPERLNALQFPLVMEIANLLEEIINNEAIRVIVFQGAGRCFCSGDDLISMGPDGANFPPLDNRFKVPHHKLMYLIRKIQKPVIALLHGYCLGAGFELALACDFRLAADNLEIGDHRVSRAICMIHGASWFLPRLIGLARATDIILTGRHLDAQEALEIGLIHKVYPFSEFKEKAGEFINFIAKLPTKCLGYNKAMLNFSLTNGLLNSLQNEFYLFTENMKSYDFREGNKSFIEKRDPKFKGR